jgi:hypothetical protein
MQMSSTSKALAFCAVSLALVGGLAAIASAQEMPAPPSQVTTFEETSDPAATPDPEGTPDPEATPDPANT